jgi:myo-inositol 2-dehydrogenase/D-chiro-inositol 1-dehydrogenase
LFVGDSADRGTDAIPLFEAAIAGGWDPARVEYGGVLLFGMGVPADSSRAVDLYREAATRNFAPAELGLGLIFQSGKGLPVDLDAARIEACLKVVAASGQPLMIGFNRRFDPSFAEARRRIRAGEIGPVELVTILSRDPSPPPPSYVARSGGLFRDMMIHDFDMARFLLGEEPVEVHAVASCLVDPGIGAAGDVDTAAVLLKTASGKIAQISNSRRASYGYDQRFEVHGAMGMVSARNVPVTTVEIATAAGFRTDPAQPFFL